MTAQTVYDITMSLIDERLDSGVIDTTSTAVFLKNAPYLLTLLQNELIPDSDYFKTETITKSTVTSNAGNYQAYTMPSDFYSSSQIISIETGQDYSGASNYYWEASNIILIPDSFVGTFKIVYRPIPDAITSLSDSMVLDGITCSTVLAYGLASRLLTNENRVLANYFGQLYDESRARLKAKKKNIATETKIISKDDLSY